MAIPTNRIHIATADGFITDLDGNAVVLYGADARSPKGDASHWREIADESCWGLIGREWAEDAAGEALAAYTLRDGKIVEDQP